MEQPAEKQKLYYLQDTRGHTPPMPISWWRKGHHGYTYDLREAHIFTQDELDSMNLRDTDVPWCRDFIQTEVQHCYVDLYGARMAHDKFVADNP